MTWTTFLSWLKKHRPKTSANTKLDHKLVKNSRQYFFPRWSQLKYLRHFLSTMEKRLAIIGLALSVIGLVGLFTVFLTRHIISLPKEGGEYTEGLVGQPKYINPLFASSNDVDADITSLIYTGLFRRAGDAELAPDLATKYTISADQKTYTINLRSDVQWSDGKPFTANDVLYTFDLIQNPEVGSPLLATFQGVKVEKTSDTEIRFTLKEPFAPFLKSLTVGILPEHIWGESLPASIRLAKYNLEPIGTGAWQFSKLVKGPTGKVDSFTLVKNPHYYGDSPFIKTVTFKLFDDYASAAEALRSQTVSALNFVPASVQSKLGSKNLIDYPVELPQYTALFFNQNFAPVLKNDALRLALATAIDKNKIIFTALNSRGMPIDGPILPGSFGYDTSTKAIAYDVSAANAALDKTWTRLEPEAYFKLQSELMFKNFSADFDEYKKINSSTPEKIATRQQEIDKQISVAVRKVMPVDQTFYRRDKDNHILELVITTVDTPEYNEIAKLVASMWSDLGIKTTITTIDSHQIVRDILKKRDYQILLFSAIMSYDPDPLPFWHSSQTDYPGLNIAEFADRTADKALEDARATTDSAKRANLYKKFQQIVAKNIPAVFLFSPTHTFIAAKNIQGINLRRLETPSDRFNNINQWYIKTRWQWK